MKVLLVDDSVAHAQSLTRLLEGMGHSVVGHALTGAIGVRLFEKQRPDLVIMDVVMPEMDGFTALRLIRACDENAAVVMLTATAGIGGQVDKAHELGARTILSKPVSPEELQRALERMAGESGQP